MTNSDDFAKIGKELWENAFPGWDAREFAADRAASAAADMFRTIPEEKIGDNFLKFLQLRAYFKRVLEAGR